MTRYRAVGFDYGGVIKGDPDPKFLKEICSLLGLSYDEYRIAFYRHNKMVNRGEISWEQLWERFLFDVGQPEKQREVLRLFNKNTHRELNKDMVNLVDRLHSKGYKVGILSNNTKEAATKIRSELASHFDVIEVSAETGYVKPEAEAFINFAASLGTKLEEMIFIDDSHKSLSTAKELGYTPIDFRGYDDLIKRLTALGVLD